MEWFHFSDFHIGKPKGPQDTALGSLLEAVRDASKKGSGAVDAIVITGDIAHSGKREEYDEFIDLYRQVALGHGERAGRNKRHFDQTQ